MATKKQIEKLENLLEWQREDRLFDPVKLFNQKISDSLMLREIGERMWELEAQHEMEGGEIMRTSTPLKHTTLVSLGLAILEAVNFSRNR